MLYMLGQVVLDINDNYKQKYLIKVGLSRKLNQRLTTYKSDNPSAIVFDTIAGVERAERKCHRFLSQNGEWYSGEWYQVSEEFFAKCREEGFSFFPLLMRAPGSVMDPGLFICPGTTAPPSIHNRATARTTAPPHIHKRAVTCAPGLPPSGQLRATEAAPARQILTATSYKLGSDILHKNTSCAPATFCLFCIWIFLQKKLDIFLKI